MFVDTCCSCCDVFVVRFEFFVCLLIAITFLFVSFYHNGEFIIGAVIVDWPYVSIILNGKKQTTNS